jgi:hypothetical protein
MNSVSSEGCPGSPGQGRSEQGGEQDRDETQLLACLLNLLRHQRHGSSTAGTRSVAASAPWSARLAAIPGQGADQVPISGYDHD